jgi:hypothetical protein
MSPARSYCLSANGEARANEQEDQQYSQQPREFPLEQAPYERLYEGLIQMWRS